MGGKVYDTGAGMQKPFEEALIDGFKLIKHLSDPEQIKKLRDEGILIDSEGIYVFEFGDHKEYSLNIEPITEGYLVSLYKNRIRLTEPLPVQPLTSGT